MINLQDFVYIYEEKQEIRYLISDYESDNTQDMSTAIGFFKENGLGDLLDVIKKIYDFRDQNLKNKEVKSRPAPIIANYNNVNGNFAVRRWVTELIPGIEKELKKSKKYKGAHNTNLKDINGAWVPTAAQVESIISNAYNQINGICKLKKVEGENLTTSENVINYYIDNKEIYDKIASFIPSGKSEIYKLPNQKNSVTSKWKNLGNYTSSDKVDNTPKTDIVSKDGKYKISLKKKEGGAQLMSAGYCEARATLLTALENSEIKGEEAEELKKLLEPRWFKAKLDKTISELKKEGNKEILDAEENIQSLKDLVIKYVEKYPKFKKALYLEAATGNTKYDSGISAANYVLVWSDSKPESTEFYKIEDYVEKLTKESVELLFVFKSANQNSWQTFRIIVG